MSVRSLRSGGAWRNIEMYRICCFYNCVSTLARDLIYDIPRYLGLRNIGLTYMPFGMVTV